MDSDVVWEQRWHPLREEWVLYTSHRGGRPWVGETVAKSGERPPAYDPECALCPGNKRLKGSNPAYTGAYWFTNDLPPFGAEVGGGAGGGGLYRTRPALGTAEVVCYHPDHGKTFADLTDEEALAVVRLWRERYVELGRRPEVDHILVFENRGSLVGTSNPHPHCQIYAGNLVYAVTAREEAAARRHLESTGRYLGLDIVERERAGARVIHENDDFIACVPWFARYAYEVLILPRFRCASLAEVNEARQARLAALMVRVARTYDALWGFPMPYVMALHQAPTSGAFLHFPFHVEYHPPLRKPDTMKYLAGPEIGGGSMTNESNPDEKAAELMAAARRLA